MARTSKPEKISIPLEEELVEEGGPEEDEALEEAEEIRPPGRIFDIIAIALCLVGVGISSYLTYTDILHKPIACFEGNSCDVVNGSKYAYLFGVPVAVLGLLFYLGLLAGSITRAVLTNRAGEAIAKWRWQLDLLLLIGALGGVAFTAYLKAMEIFVIGAICIWCVGSAITVSLLFILFIVRFLRS